MSESGDGQDVRYAAKEGLHDRAWEGYHFRSILVPKYHMARSRPLLRSRNRHNNKEVMIMWTKPAYTDLRIGFEVTMYFANR